MKYLIRTFGRIHGKKLSPRQQGLVDNFLPTLLPKFPSGEGNFIRVLEIGFGSGEHIVHLAQNPDFFIVGAEPFMNGVASLLSKIEGTPAEERIRIWPGDAREYLEENPVQFDMIYILHPDPWPKEKHEKRRLLSTEFLNGLERNLSPSGLMIVGSDHYSYLDWTKTQINDSIFKLLNKDELTPPSSGLSTRYSVKNKFGSPAPRYLVLGRRTEDFPSPERLARLDLTLA
ncbi:MAG: hypothetical protein LBH81_01860 [Rickettsiales bacterium]|jgi:tRNA (guanine-N7-)-methyltransferase|nr:hypothetical protein [Rickettsiales bacterium]